MNLSPLVQRSKHWFATAIAETGRITGDPAFNSWGGLTFHIANCEMERVECDSCRQSFLRPPKAESWCSCGSKKKSAAELNLDRLYRWYLPSYAIVNKNPRDPQIETIRQGVK